MAQSPLVSALVNIRAELAGELAVAEKKQAQLRADLLHIDAVIRLMSEVIDPTAIPAKRICKSHQGFKAGEGRRLAAEVKEPRLGGEGKVVEVDGAYFGGHIRPENKKEDRKDRRLSENQNGKKQCVVTVRERDGRTVTGVFASEEAATGFIKERVAKGTAIHADESNAYNALHAKYRMFRVNHSVEYRGEDGACTNGAESFFARMRRGEIGHHHRISDKYLRRYAQEAAFREDRRRNSNGEQFKAVVSLVAANAPSVDFCGYWQRNRRAA